MRPRHYTAENVAAHRHLRDDRERFNEAAALHRGKPALSSRETNGITSASMRPRHYTAENGRSDDPAMHRVCASMRPRHYTAENAGWTGSPSASR